MNLGFEKARPLAGRAAARLHELVGIENEGARAAARRQDAHVVPARASGAQQVTKVRLHVATPHAKLARQ